MVRAGGGAVMVARFIAEKIREPKLRFFGDNISDKPIDGLRAFGPVDLRSRKFTKMQVYVVHDGRRKDLVNAFVDRLKKSAEDLLKLELEVKKEIIVDQKDLTTYLARIENEIESPVRDGEIVLQVLREKEETIDKSPYYQLRIRLLGRKDPIPVQSILYSTLENLRSAIPNNVMLSMYAKCGGKPWFLAESVSELFNNVLYIGYDISGRIVTREGKKVPRTGTAIVYDNEGQYIYFTKYEIQTDKEVIPKESIRGFIYNVVRDVIAKKREIEGIVIHRDGEIYREEIEGIAEVAKSFNLSLAILSFPKKAPALIDVSNNMFAEPGWYFHAGLQLVRKETYLHTFYLQGFRFPYREGRKVNLLKYRIAYLWKNFLVSGEKIHTIYKDIARQNLYLSRLNWGTALGKSKSPVTIHYAHKSSKLLSSGLDPRMLDEDKLFMI